MKIVYGPQAHDFTLYDNDGQKLNLFVTKMDISVRPGGAPQVTLEVMVDELVADMPDADIMLSAQKLYAKKT